MEKKKSENKRSPKSLWDIKPIYISCKNSKSLSIEVDENLYGGKL